MTSGLPHSDGISYQTYIDSNLPIPATYVGNPSDAIADSGAAMVGGDGNYISRIPKVGGGANAAVFPQNGVQESFDTIKASVTVPDYVVVMVGTNDLMQLIAPNDINDSFAPDTAGDFTAGGIFTDVDGMGSSDHDVDPIIDRYESLLDDVAGQFPVSTQILCIAVPPVDPAGTFGGPGSAFDRAKAELATTIPDYNTDIQNLVATKGSRFTFLDPNVVLADISDGLHPNPVGYEKIGVTIANFINGNPVSNPYNDWLAAKFSAGDLNNPALEATVWGRQANPDDDAWTNEFEFYFDLNPNAFDEPDLVGSQVGNDYVVTFSKNEDAALSWASIEYSEDMSTWSMVGLSTQVTGAPSGGVVPVEVSLTATGLERIFFRFLSAP